MSKKPRGVNIRFVLVEEFEIKSEFDEFWTENEFSKIDNHHVERACRIGFEDVLDANIIQKTVRVGNQKGVNKLTLKFILDDLEFYFFLNRP